MVRRSDRYQVQQFLKKQPRGSRRLPTWHDVDGMSVPILGTFIMRKDLRETSALGLGLDGRGLRVDTL